MSIVNSLKDTENLGQFKWVAEICAFLYRISLNRPNKVFFSQF